MKISAAVCAGILALSPFAVQADTVFGFYAGAGTWQQEYSGDVQSGLTRVDVEDDLGMTDDDSNIVLYAAIEHPIPVLPNLRAQYLKVDTSGENVLDRTIEFNGETFIISEALSTSVELTQADAVLYYELLDNVVSLDLGLAISMIEGEIAVIGTFDSAVAEFDEIIPMLYGKVRGDLPFTGFWVAAEAQGMKYDGNGLMQANAHVGYESDVGLGFEIGYRLMQLEIDSFEDVDNAEVDIAGPYAAINFHF